MNNNDVFVRPPKDYDIPNLGVAKITTPTTPQEWDVLDFELRNFVCEGEYRRGLERVLETFVTNLDRPQQPAAWVSGFYGSGKSHFVRVLEALWKDTRLPSGATARGIVPLPTEVQEKLRELKTEGDRHGGLWAAAGKLGSSAGSIRLGLLAIILNAAGFPEDYAKARFVLYFHQQGTLDGLVKALEARGETLDEVLNYMSISDELAESVLAVQPNFAASVTEVKTRIEHEFPSPSDISTADLLQLLTQVLKTKSTKPAQVPLTLLIFDELQQFMGGDPEKADELLSVVEDISARLESKMLFVGTGQSEMGATAELQKLQDRFKVRVTLGVSDVDNVVRRVVLSKKPEALSSIETKLGNVAGEIDRQLAGTAIAPSASDAKDLVQDYPLLPARRRFWDRVLRGFDSLGRAGQLRTQLRVVHEAVKEVADRPLGWVVASDALFDQQRSDMLQTGALLREVASTIDDLAAEQPDGPLASRLCKLIFLISKVPTEGMMVAGIRSDSDTLADLLVEDLNVGSASLRQKVPEVLDALAKRGILLPLDGGEFRLQTKEGTEWQQAYQTHLISEKANLPRLTDARVEEFKKAIGGALKDVKVLQGASKESRKVTLHLGDQPPPSSTAEIPIWMRDEWSETENRVRSDAQAAGVDSATVFVFLPKRHADQLVDTLASIHARDATLTRPAPTTDAGREARASMQAQLQRDRERLDEILKAVLADSLVLQGGGTEAAGANLPAKLTTATAASAGRLFPKFDMADNPRWGDVLPFIKQGNGDPLQKVGYNGEAQNHPVCKEVLTYLGNRSEKGSAIRAHFIASPFGWPRDAIDGSLMALVAASELAAKRNGQVVEARSFDTNTIAGADFQRESNIVTAAQRIALRALAKDISGLNVKAGDESEAVRIVLDQLRDLAASAGGAAPLPAPPDADLVMRLRQYTGNQQLSETFNARDDLRANFKDWTDKKNLAAERTPHWERLKALSRHAEGLPVAAEVSAAIQAIQDGRRLLDQADPTLPLRQKLSDALRAAVSTAHAQLEAARVAAVQTLEGTAEWPKLTAEQQQQILRENQLTPVAAPSLGSDDEVVETLNRIPLADWHDKLAAIPGRLENARRQAALILAPESITLSLPKWTINQASDLDDFLAAVRKEVEPHIGKGPIII